MTRILSAAGALIALAAAWPPAFAAASPADPGAAVRPLVHRSTLAARAASAPPETAPGDWRAANARVHAVGGWRTYLKQAHAPEPAASGTEGGAR
ncbi:hypothetical protein ACU6VI_04080 [Sphaerotilus natans]|jgi:hypothetical protein|uniref:hypothetical protein n=1 Tax=Sphaerotilus natans TaxID=34103 RepID=UPI00406D2A2D